MYGKRNIAILFACAALFAILKYVTADIKTDANLWEAAIWCVVSLVIAVGVLQFNDDVVPSWAPLTIVSMKTILVMFDTISSPTTLNVAKIITYLILGAWFTKTASPTPPKNKLEGEK